MPLVKRRSGFEDAPSAVEIMYIMEELSNDMQTAFDVGDVAAVDRIYNRMLR
jgi:NCAIR mutase (PurE)-related protein